MGYYRQMNEWENTILYFIALSFYGGNGKTGNRDRVHEEVPYLFMVDPKI